MKEIEKKYLLRENNIEFATKNLAMIASSVGELEEKVLKSGEYISQGYLLLEEGINIYVLLNNSKLEFEPKEARLRRKAGKYTFTLKGDGSLERDEFEAEIPISMFEKYWELTKRKRVEKARLKEEYDGNTAEIDVYTDRDLIIAEIEVDSIEKANALKPLGKDVTEDKKYKNKNLAK